MDGRENLSTDLDVGIQFFADLADELPEITELIAPMPVICCCVRRFRTKPN